MSRAMQAVMDGGMSIRRALIEYNVPKSNLGHQISGSIVHGTKSGKSQHLSEKEQIFY